MSDFSDILYQKAKLHADKSHVTRNSNFKIQDGGRPQFRKSLNRHSSVKNHPILMKFGTLQQILNPMTVLWPKI